jgi:lipoyl(octanoyl) transferase
MNFLSLPGTVGYAEARALQLDLVTKRIRDEIPDTFVFLEHRPVITRGRGLQFTGQVRERHMPLPAALPPGIEFAESERGGDLTYHGPGQWVVYPICKLDGKGFGPNHDVTGFLRRLERVVIDLLADRGVKARAEADATGVWIQDRKVASMGIAVRSWVTYHGLALNCVNDLAPFSLISPCGFDAQVMTRLCDWVELGPRWREEWETEFEKRVRFDVA